MSFSTLFFSKSAFICSLVIISCQTAYAGSSFQANTKPLYDSCIRRCEEPNKLALLTKDGCYRGCAEIHDEFPLEGKRYSSYDTCQKDVQKIEVNKRAIIKEAQEWCNQEWTHPYKRKGCKDAIAVFYSAATATNICGRSVSPVKTSPTIEPQKFFQTDIAPVYIATESPRVPLLRDTPKISPLPTKKATIKKRTTSKPIKQAKKEIPLEVKSIATTQTPPSNVTVASKKQLLPRQQVNATIVTNIPSTVTVAPKEQSLPRRQVNATIEPNVPPKTVASLPQTTITTVKKISQSPAVSRQQPKNASKTQETSNALQNVVQTTPKDQMPSLLPQTIQPSTSSQSIAKGVTPTPMQTATTQHINNPASQIQPQQNQVALPSSTVIKTAVNGSQSKIQQTATITTQQRPSIVTVQPKEEKPLPPLPAFPSVASTNSTQSVEEESISENQASMDFSYDTLKRKEPAMPLIVPGIRR